VCVGEKDKRNEDRRMRVFRELTPCRLEEALVLKQKMEEHTDR
jgi:hypothetical protein